jgi:hypothetical protein
MVARAIAHPAPTPEPCVRAFLSHQALPTVGLHGRALAGYPPRR